MPKAKTGAYGEKKTAQLMTLVTPTAKNLLQEKANSMNISLGELLERFARGQLEERTQLLGECFAVRSNPPAI